MGVEGRMVMGRAVVKSWARPTCPPHLPIYCPPCLQLPSSLYCPPLHILIDPALIRPTQSWLHFAVLGSIGEDQQPEAIRLVQGAYYAHILPLLCYASNAGQCLNAGKIQCTVLVRVASWCSAVELECSAQQIQ